ncbi:hypothetical protein BGZ76_006632 [Entomortierella beljakovae]|nr:hypothetical protein BGZ76_006632 [Entomortierella beljakovae]
MSNARNRRHHLTILMARENCVHVRRMMGRKHQVYRREQFTATMYHNESIQHNDMTWTPNSLRSVSCNPTTRGANSNQYLRNNYHTKDTNRFNEGFPESGVSMSATQGVSRFNLGYGSQYQREAQESGILPLTPVVQRIDMESSFFPSYIPCSTYESMECSDLVEQYQVRPGNAIGGARAHSSGGGGSGGGGGSDGPTSDDMTPGGGDSADGDQPSEYTYRRRNAIVEGSDEAPKADDFPSASPK